MTAFLVCPGRGSYTRTELGTLQRLTSELGNEGRTLLDRLSALHRELDPEGVGLETLDGAEEFRASMHLKGRNASPLIYTATILDSLLAKRRTHPVAVAGNSLGFYSSLVVSGALDPLEGLRLVMTMARLQESGPKGGQVLWTFLDDDWVRQEEREEQLARILNTLRAEGRAVDLSIRLGGHIVIAGDPEAIQRLLAQLPKVQLGKREFPFQLAFHGPFHTRLLLPVAELATRELSDLRLSPPQIPLIDGKGKVWNRTNTVLEALHHYTLYTQVTETFDFSAALRVGLLDFAASQTVLLAPGASLRAPLGHIEKQLRIQSTLVDRPSRDSEARS